jgi:hypothetical protein
MHSKIMTRDNLKKRNLNRPETRVFYFELESVQHLFDCIVAKLVWQDISSFFGKTVGSSIGAIAHGLPIRKMLLLILFVLRWYGPFGTKKRSYFQWSNMV